MARELAEKTYWLVGASEGLGRALAVALHKEGARLVLSARNAGRLQALADDLSGARALALDVTDSASVRQAVGDLGHVDGVIYCAGAYAPMTAQSWDPAQAEHIADVNFMGALRVLGPVVRDMAARNAGHVVLIGSLAGFTGLPGAIGYGASKAGVMHLAETLQADLRGSGVAVQLVNPGFIRTRLTDRNDFAMPMLMSPETAAAKTLGAMKKHRFSTSFPAPFSWVFTLGRFLPRTLFLRLVSQR